ncbi:BgTH12-04792, partial [Blumeria graminis f. sp. triticale]
DTIGCSPRVSYLTLDYHNGKYEQHEPSYPPALEGQQPDPQARLFRSRTSLVYPSVPRDEEPPVFQDFRHDACTNLPCNKPNEKLEPSAVIKFSKHRNKKSNHDGLIYDVFDGKVHQLLRTRELLEIRLPQLHVFFDQMHKDRALFYYTRMNENPDKGLRSVLNILVDKLSICERAMGTSCKSDDKLRDQLMRTWRHTIELTSAINKAIDNLDFMDKRGGN